MPDFVFVTTLNSIQDLYIAKPLLESEGIIFYIKNENMLQMNPLYSNATGGLDVMVATSDAPRAYDILTEAGYIVEETDPIGLPLLDSIKEGLHSFSDSLPQLKNIWLFRRFGIVKPIVFLLVIIVLSVGIWYKLNQKVAADLNYTMWTVYGIFVDRKEVKTNTIHLNESYIAGRDTTFEVVDFNGHGEITLPGFDSKAVTGQYTIDDASTLTISRCNIFGDFYEGVYDVRFTDDANEVTLVKGNMEIQLRNY